MTFIVHFVYKNDMQYAEYIITFYMVKIYIITKLI